jgi:predicted metallo-beta-lactamase superfamily hydrolase
LILEEKPQLIMVGGPPVYLEGLVRREDIQVGMQNLADLVSEVPTTIIGHHLLRAENWQEASAPIFAAASTNGRSVVTAAQFVNKENNVLESKRKQLFETEPLSDEFKKWMKLPLEQRRLVKPPI